MFMGKKEKIFLMKNHFNMKGNSQHEEKLSYRMIQDEISAGYSKLQRCKLVISQENLLKIRTYYLIVKGKCCDTCNKGGVYFFSPKILIGLKSAS